MLDRGPIKKKTGRVLQMEVGLNVSGLIAGRFRLWEVHGKGASLTRDACGRNVSCVCPGDGPGQAQAQTEARL